MAVKMEDMGFPAESIHVPDYFFVETGLEDGVIGEVVAV